MAIPFIQEIFPTQGSTPSRLCVRQILHHLSQSHSTCSKEERADLGICRVSLVSSWYGVAKWMDRIFIGEEGVWSHISWFSSQLHLPEGKEGFLSLFSLDQNSLQYSCLENPMDRGVWQATVHRVPKSWTWLKQFHMPASTSLDQKCHGIGAWRERLTCKANFIVMKA